MAHRPGGFDPNEVNQALQAFVQAGSLDDLQQLIDQLPIVRDPFWHAIIRQEYYRLRNQHSPNLPDFTNRYYALFMLLHVKAHRALADAASPATVGLLPPVQIFAPPFFLQLAGLLGREIPIHQGLPLHPVRDAAQIQREVSAVMQRAISLPAYQPLAGTAWSAVIVGCPACRRRWLTWRAYAVDLVQAPQLAQPLQAGQINNAACPYCGGVLCEPLQVWIQDGPGSGDALAALSCIWRLSPTAYSYQPPPGTPRIEQNDRILEIRCDQLKDSFEWPQAQPEPLDQGAEVVSLTVAYTLDELLGYLEESVDAGQFSQAVLVMEICRKLQSGILPYHQAEAFIRQTVAQVGLEWPLVHPGYPASGQPEVLIHYLVEVLIAEGVADAQARPAGVRAMLAASTTQVWLMLGEASLAESALARAEDLLAAAPADDEQRPIYETAVAEARAEVYDLLSTPQAADHQRAQAMAFLAGQDTLMARLAARQIASAQALTLYETGQLAQALEAFSQGVEALNGLLAKAGGSQDPAEQALVPVIQHTLSGDLANRAAVLTDLAEALDIYIQLSIMPEVLRDRYIAANGLPAEVEVIQDAFPALDRMFGQGLSVDTLLDMAGQLLGQALELSRALQAWEFAGVQAHRLGVLLKDREAYEAAEEMFKQAITYAARAGDHTRVWSACAFLADRCMGRDEGPAALEYLEKAAREWIREKVGLGFHAELGSEILTLAEAALRTVAMGAEPLSAVAVVESLKAATTAASLARGMPVQPGEFGSQARERLSQLTQEREVLRMQALADPDDHALAEQLQQKNAEVQQERQQLSLRDPRFGEWVDATDIDLTDGKALLERLAQFGPKATLLGLLPLEEQLWSYAVWADGCLVEQRPLPEMEAGGVGAMVSAEAHRSMRPSTSDAAESAAESPSPWIQQSLAALAEAILAPLEARLAELGPDDRLILSTAGALSRVPLAGLPFRGAPLGALVTLSQIQGVGILEACLARPARAYESALCLGEPQRPELKPLPGALAEAQAIHDLFTALGKPAKLLTGAQATPQALAANAARFEVVHIACHALASGGPGDMASLMLTPDPQAQESGNLVEDRIIGELSLLPGCFVNLAGCSTGTQTESTAPLLGGLIPAFLVAGASSVLGSLWPIRDRAAARFQTEFYNRLVEGKPPAASLAQVQRQCLAGELGVEMQALENWAGFVVFGAG